MARHGTTRDEILADPVRLRRLLAELRDGTATRAALAARFGLTRQAVQRIGEAHGIYTPKAGDPRARAAKVARL